LVAVHPGKAQIQEYEVGAGSIDVLAFVLQEGQRFFTICDNMHLARASRVAKGREREMNIGWIILYQQYSDGSFSSGHTLASFEEHFVAAGVSDHFREGYWGSTLTPGCFPQSGP
jgi:hypothetical protein